MRPDGTHSLSNPKVEAPVFRSADFITAVSGPLSGRGMTTIQAAVGSDRVRLTRFSNLHTML